MKIGKWIGLAATAALMTGAGLLVAQGGGKKYRKSPTGYSDTPVLPGQKWKVHDIDRPKPRVVTPGAKPGDPPSDAIVLFDGKDLSKWMAQGKQGAGLKPANWKVAGGYMEVTPGAGTLVTVEVPA